MKKYVIALVFNCASMVLHAQSYLVTDYGAVADGSTLNTASIQAAIDDCNANGGGEVVFAGGDFLTGTIIVKSNVKLKIESGAKILGSASIGDYPDIEILIPTYVNNYSKKALIFAEGEENIGIVGSGTLDGQGLSFLNMNERPFGFRFVSCSNVLIEDVELRSSAFWMMHNFDVDSLVIRNVDIFNHGNANNDGITIDGCRNVLVENCTVDSNDDPMVLKTTGPANCENVEIRNCTVATWSRAIKIGTETHAGFRNIHIHDVQVEWSSLAVPLIGVGAASCGFNLAIVDGGFMENVLVEDITMEGVETAIFIRLGNRGRVWEDGLPAPAVGYLRDVTIHNVTATQESNITSSITGIPGHYASNITLENIVVNFPGGASDPGPGFVVPENEDAKPDNDIFGPTLPSYGLYVRHVDSLQLTNVCFNWDSPDQRMGIIMDDVTNTPAYVLAGSDGGCAQLASGIAEQMAATPFWVDFNGIFHCPKTTASMTLEVYNSLGQVLTSKPNVKITEDLSALSKGVYLAVLRDGAMQQALRFVR